MNDTERNTDRGPGTTGLQGYTLFTGKSWVAHHRDGDLGLHNVALGSWRDLGMDWSMSNNRSWNGMSPAPP